MKNTFYRFLLLPWLLLAAWGARAQTLLQQQSFETSETVNYTATAITTNGNIYFYNATLPVPGFNTGSGQVSTVTNINGVAAGSTGTHFWASENVRRDANGIVRGNPAANVTLNSLNVAGKSNLFVTVALADAAGLPNNTVVRWETDDYVRVQYSFDGGTTWNTIGQFVGDDPGTGGSSGKLRQDMNLDGISNVNLEPNSPVLNQTLTDYSFNIPGSGNNLQVRVQIDQDGASEEFGFDNIRVYGSAAASAAPVLSNIEGTALAYTEGQAATAITGALTVADPDNTTLSSAVISISANYQASEDRLSFTGDGTTGNIVAGTFDTNLGRLTLTSASSTATLAQWQSALRKVLYQNTDGDDASALTRTVSFVVTDPTGVTSASVTRNITVATALDVAYVGLPYVEPFETNGEGTRYASNHFYTQDAAQFQRTTSNPITGGTTFSNIAGSAYWVGVNTAGGVALNPTGTNNGTLTTKLVNAAGYTNLHFQIRLGASTSVANGNLANWKTTDYFQLLYRPAGSATWTAFGLFRGTSTTSSGGVIRQDSNPTGTGAPTGTQLTSALQNFDFTLPIALNGQTVDFQLLLVNQDGVNFFAFDQIQVTGTQAVAPTVTTATPATITSTSAVLGGNVTADGGATVTDRGVVYSVYGTNLNPTIGGTGVTTAPNSGGTGSFSATIAGLAPSTTYAVAAYATNSQGTSYGSVLAFTTPALPAVTSLAPPSGPVGRTVVITGVRFAPGATVTFGGTTATVVTVSSATQITAQVPAGASTGNVVVTTSAGSSNAAAANFFTVTSTPTVATATPASVGSTSAVLGGNVTADGGATVTDRGVVYSVNSTNANPTIGGTGVTTDANGTAGTGAFSEPISGLTPGTTYAVRAYATNNAGTSYGGVQTFTTAAALTTTGTQTNVSCNGGSNGTATVTVSGGTSPYTYSWSPSVSTTATATGLSAGTYTVTVTDATGATTQRTFTITQPSAPVGGSGVITNVSCNGGSNGTINLTPTGGTGPYTFLWSPGGQTTEDRTGLAAGTYSVTITDVNGCTATRSFTVTQPASAVGGTTVVTNVSCFGGSNGTINLTPTGGAGPYTFLWSPGGQTTEDRTGLSAGTYSVTITDVNGCTGTVSATVTQPASAVGGSGVITNVSCNGGSNGTINLTPTGGTPGYTFLWSPGGVTTEDRTGLSAGTYSVTITDANGCTATRSFTVTQPASAVGGTTVVTNVSCFGGSNGTINLTPTGGAGPYTFLWSPGGQTTEDRTGLAAGAYSVTITDVNGCTGTVSNIIVTQPSAINLTANSQTNLSCNGGSNGSASVTPSGGAGSYTYSWSPNVSTTSTATGLMAGTYTVTVTDANGCTASRSFTISQPPALTATTSQTNLSCTGSGNGSATITVGGGTPGYTYSWSPNVSTTNTATGLSAGTYSVTATDANGCTIQRSFTITQPNLLATTGTQTNVTTNGGSNGSATVSVSGGTPGYTYSWSPNVSTTATASNLSAGTYTVTVTDANSCTTTYTFTITQPAPPTITVAPATLAGGIQGTAYSQTITASGGTGPYAYAFTGTLPTSLTLDASTGLLSGTPTASGSFTFTVTATDAGGFSGSRAYTVVIAAPLATLWTGTSSTDWFTANNWTAGVPTTSIDATIPTAPSGNRFPLLMAGTASARNLTLNSGASLTQSNGTLVLAGNLTNNGTYQPTGGTVNLGTTAQSSILGSGNTRFWNLTVGANGAQSSTPASTSVQRLLTLNGTFTTNGNPLTLESNANLTALVVNNGSAVVSGNVTVQRYIDATGNTGTSGYRHYSSPVGGATVGSLSTSNYGGSFTAQVNTLYNTADPNQLTLATYPNVFGYDESKIAASPAVSFSDFDKGYQSPASLGDALTVGRGYAVQIGNTEKVQLTGPLNNSTQTIGGLTYAAANTSGAASAGWALIGNPYPAPLDWGTVANSQLTSVDAAAYVFQSTSAYAGRYTSFINGVGTGTGRIATGQGFFVHSSTPGTTGSIALSNANRVTTYTNPAFQRTTAETRPLLRLSLALGNAPATVATAQDETFVYFEQGASDGFDGKFDAYKLANPSGYYLGSVTPGASPLGLSIDARSPLAVATLTEIPLWVSLPAGSYSLTATELLNFASLAGGTQVQLRDALLGTLTDLSTTPSHSFQVAANAPYAGRFSLVFRTSSALATAPAVGTALVSLYPNPVGHAQGAVTLAATGLPAGVTTLEATVLNALGQVVSRTSLPAVVGGAVRATLSTQQLATGIYQVRLTGAGLPGGLTCRLTID